MTFLCWVNDIIAISKGNGKWVNIILVWDNFDEAFAASKRFEQEKQKHIKDFNKIVDDKHNKKNNRFIDSFDLINLFVENNSFLDCKHYYRYSETHLHNLLKEENFTMFCLNISTIFHSKKSKT